MLFQSPMNLADARFTHSQHGTDFLQVQLLLVVQRHHQLLELRQALDRTNNRVAHAVTLDAFLRTKTACVSHVSSDERHVVKESVSPGRSRWCAYNSNKKSKSNYK